MAFIFGNIFHSSPQVCVTPYIAKANPRAPNSATAAVSDVALRTHDGVTELILISTAGSYGVRRRESNPRSALLRHVVQTLRWATRSSEWRCK